jgi:hypothetical protein
MKPLPSVVQLSPGPAKHDVTTRIAAGVKVANIAINSALYAQATVKAVVDTMNADTADLKAKLDAFNTARASLNKARTALGLSVGVWDNGWKVLCATGEQVCATADDANSLALPVLTRKSNQLEVPLGLDFLYNTRKDQARIHVHRAPGMDAVVVQYSVDPITATSWVELDGCGAIHILPPLNAGTYWARAASKTARATSAWTIPVSLIIK